MATYKAALAGLTAAYGPPTSEVPEKYYHAWALGDVQRLLRPFIRPKRG